MGISPIQTSTVTQTPTSSTQVAAILPNQEPAPGSPAFNVPKGQLDRTRGNLPQGWSNDGGHKGFKSATITQVADGYQLTAKNHSDVPRGRQ